MKKVVFLFVFFLVFSVFGFEAKYSFSGNDWSVFKTQSPNHEKITTRAFTLVCSKQQGIHSSDGDSFINNNLNQFIDDYFPSCEYDEIESSIGLIKKSVGYNDHTEIDGLTATLTDLRKDNKEIFQTIKGLCFACLISPIPALCVLPESTIAAICFTTWATTERYFKISDQADLGNEDRYPLMHAGLNGENIGNNPTFFLKVMRNYIRSYFYELVVLGLTSDENQPTNKFVHFDDVTQHPSTDTDKFIKTGAFQKVLLGEIIHSIEDSFAHNLRYLDEIVDTKGGKQKVLKIGAIINMKPTIYGKDVSFSHNDDFKVLDFNCKRVDNTANWNENDEVNTFIPFNMNNLSYNSHYFEPAIVNNKIYYFIDEHHSSVMASVSIADFLFILGRAIEDIKKQDFNGNYKDVIEPLIEDYLSKWFTDGTEIFIPKLHEEFFVGTYSEIFKNELWENFQNIDFWVESKNQDAFHYDGAFVPWVDPPQKVKCKEDVLGNTMCRPVVFSNRWVFKTIENYPGRPEYVENAENSYESDTKIMTFKKSSLTIMWSWLDGDKLTEVKNSEGEGFADKNFLENIDPEEPVYTLPLENSEGREVSPAAIYIPRGFKVCLKYSTENDEIDSEDDNDAARFWKMPTYRCFYGGENGRLITGGKEDALKPGTQIFVLPIDMDGDGFYDGKDNCPFDYNPHQEDLDGDTIGDACDPDIDGDDVENERDNCPRVPNYNQIDKDGDLVGDACDACPYDKDEWPGKPVANYKPEFVTEGFSPGMPMPLKVQYYPGTNKPIDTDSDGVPDVCDNCPEVPNPRIMKLNPFHEIFIAPCEESTDPEKCVGEGGASFMEKTRNGGKVYTWGSYYLVPSINWNRKIYVFKVMIVPGTFYAWQPDNDLDGIGDVCDYKGGRGKDTSDDPGTSTARVMKVEGINKDKNNGGALRVNSLYKLELLAAKWTEANSGNAELKSTVHFCGVPDEEYIDIEGKIRWGQTGVCTIGTADVEAEFVSMVNCPMIVGGSWCTPEYSRYKTVPFGYSHGTDPSQEASNLRDAKPWTHIAWGPTPDSAEKITKETAVSPDIRKPIYANKYVQFTTHECVNALENSGVGCSIYPYWNWRADALSYMNCDSLPYDKRPALCNQLENNSVNNLNNAATFHYSISAGAQGVSNTHILDENGEKRINPEYFHNIRKYARSFRTNLWDLHAQTYSPQIFAAFPANNNQDYTAPVFKNFHFSDIPYETKKIEYWLAGESKFRKTIKSLPENFIAMTSGEAETIYSIVSEENGIQALYVNYSEETHDWQRAFTIPNLPPELEVLGMDVIDTTMYVAGIDKEIYPAPLRVYKYDLRPSRMTSSVFHEFAEPLAQIKFIKTGNELILTGINVSSLKVYILKSDKIIEKETLPLRIGYAVETNGEDLFIAGGFDSNNVAINNVIVSKDLGATWNVLADFSNQPIDISTSFTHLSDEKMYIINPAVDTESSIKKVALIDTITGETAINRMIPEGFSIEMSSDICIYENNGSIFPGSIGFDGDCLPVYDYSYETVSYFDYKYTVAGYMNNLYLGGLTGVRRVEIRNDGALVNRDMLYTGETNNLAVYGNTMYGANYGEIDVYLIADSGSISRTRGISSSSCGNVRVYDNKLFTAENKRVRIFDLTDPQNPTLIKTISTSGKVIDLEVVGEKLYIYEETTSWFTTKGFTGIYDISNLNSPVRTKYFEKRCTDAEMQKSGNNSKDSLDEKVYLGCKNGQHRIEETGLVSVSGEKNYVREGYVFEGNLYQVFSGALHMSKTASVASVCGDEIIENGEVCDGNIVECSSIDSSYFSGIAACNSTCDGYNESVCESDGW